MPEYFSSASQATCTAIAQILPVFLVALVAERIARTRMANDPIERAQLVAATIARIVIDFAMMIGIVFFMLLALMGIELDGLEGTSAKTLWIGTGMIALLVAYRWLLFSTPLLGTMNRLAARYGTIVARALDWLLTVLPKGLDWLAIVVARGMQVVGEAVFGVLAAGMSHGIEALADWISRRLLRSARPPSTTAVDVSETSSADPPAPN